MSNAGYDILRALASRAGVPSGVHLQVADRCNHSCQHCYQVQGRKGEMSGDEIRAVLDDLSESGVMVLNVSGGEALLRDDLLEVLRYARSKGFALRLFTNGYLVTDAIAHELADIGVLAIEVSVYSDEAAQHDAITRVPGSHVRTLAGVRSLLGAGLRVHLKAPATSLAPDARLRVKRLADSLGGGVSVVSSSDITPMETGDQASRVVAATAESLLATGAISPWTPPDDLEAAIAEARARPSCGACKDGVAVLPNGDLRPCTDIVAPLGNLRERRFLELYASSDARFVAGLTWADVHGCRDCELLPGCERCHASAANEAGDLLGPYAAACAITSARYGAGAGELAFLAPSEGCAPDRDPRRGPFRIVSRGVLQAVPDVVATEDERRSEAFNWVRPSREFLETMSYGEAPSSAPARPARRRLPLLQRA
jgi:radical SAM protein with 4Fe4S-binding SPASM domain